jgi:hypothetical protein
VGGRCDPPNTLTGRENKRHESQRCTRGSETGGSDWNIKVARPGTRTQIGRDESTEETSDGDADSDA